MPLDPNVLKLMKNTCTWFQYTGITATAEATYAAGKAKTCWIEERTFRGSEGRIDTPQQTTFDPSIDMYFDGGDTDVAQFKMLDKFSVASGIESADPALVSNPFEITTFYGPDGDPWTRRVAM